MTNQHPSKTSSDAHRVWAGDYGTYPIPANVYALVKHWKKNGWPYRLDKGRAPFFAWVEEQEQSARKRLGL